MGVDPDLCATFISRVKLGDTAWLHMQLDAHSEEDPLDAHELANLEWNQLSMLMVAIRYNYPNVVQLLLQHGANPAYECHGRRLVTRKNGRKEAVSAVNVDKPLVPLTMALQSRRPYIIRMVCEAYLLQEFVSQSKFLSVRELVSVFDDPHDQLMVRDVLIDIYATVDASVLVGGIQSDFRQFPGLTLCDLIELAALSKLKSRSMCNFDPFHAAAVDALSVRLQLAAAGCLHAIGLEKDGLGRYECDEILRSPLGHAALLDALKYDCQVFVAQPEVSAYTRREWRGPLLNRAFDEADGFGSVTFRMGVGVLWLVAVGANCVLLLLSGFLPLVESVMFEYLASKEFTQLVSTAETAQDQMQVEDFQANGNASPLLSNSFTKKAPERATPSNTDVCRPATAESARGVTIASSVNANGPSAWSSGSGALGAAAHRTTRQGMKGLKNLGVSSSNLYAAHGTLKGRRRGGSVMGGTLGGPGMVTNPDLVVEGRSSERWSSIGLSELYLLRTPSFKFVARLLSNVALIVMLLLVNVTDLQRDFESGNRVAWGAMLLWAAGGCFAEYRQFAPTWQHLKYELLSFVRADMPSHYRSDVFNLTDALGFHLLLFSLLLPSDNADVAIQLWSIAGVLAWLRLIRVLTLGESLGPVVIMCVKMIGDVVKLAVLIVFILCALTSGTYIVFAQAAAIDAAAAAEANATLAGASVAPAAVSYAAVANADAASASAGADVTAFSRKRISGVGGSAELACLDFDHMNGDWLHWGWTFFAFWNGALTEEHYTSCVMASHPEYQWLVWVYSFLFSLTTAVLLLNALIAMMGKTIDNVYDASSTYSLFLFARLTLVQLEKPPEPPPLNLLRLPAYLVALLLDAGSLVLPQLQAIAEWWQQSFDYSPLPSLGSERASSHSKDTGEYIGTIVRGRTTWDAWQAAWSEERLKEFISGYVNDREQHATSLDSSEVLSGGSHNVAKRVAEVKAQKRLEESIEQGIEESLDAMLHQKGGGATSRHTTVAPLAMAPAQVLSEATRMPRTRRNTSTRNTVFGQHIAGGSKGIKFMAPHRVSMQWGGSGGDAIRGDGAQASAPSSDADDSSTQLSA